EAVAGAHLAAVEHQARHLERGRHALDVGQQLAQAHAGAHWRTPAPASGGRDAVARGAAPARSFSCCLACSASQVSMSSGGTSISRSAPSITFWNTGPATAPP